MCTDRGATGKEKTINNVDAFHDVDGADSGEFSEPALAIIQAAGSGGGVAKVVAGGVVLSPTLLRFVVFSCADFDHLHVPVLIYLPSQGEIDGLFEKRKEMELAYMESKQKRQEQYQAEIEALLTRDGEEHTKLKIKLETDIQVQL